MSLLTIISVIILITSIITGYKRGLIRSLVNISVIIGAIIVSTICSAYTWMLLNKILNVVSKYYAATRVVAFVVTLLLSYLILKLLTLLIPKNSYKTGSTTNLLYGSLFQILVGFACIVFISYVITLFSQFFPFNMLYNAARNETVWFLSFSPGKWLTSQSFVLDLFEVINKMFPEFEYENVQNHMLDNFEYIHSQIEKIISFVKSRFR